MNVPKLRFKEFDGEWEEYKLGSLGSVAMNKRIYKEETSSHGDIPFFKIGTFGGKADAFISRAKYEEYKEKYPYPQKGDLLISASGSIGRVIEYNGEEAYYQDSNIIWLKHDDRLDNLFLKQFYNIVRWSGIEGTTIKRLYNKNILETKINLPSIEEQRKIGEFFKELDNKIILQQQKIDLLQEQKKGFLQNILLKVGKSVPQLRFENFNEKWRTFKLKEVANFIRGSFPQPYTNLDWYDEENGKPFVQVADIGFNLELNPDTKLHISKIAEPKSRFVEEGKVVVALQGSIEKSIGRVAITQYPAFFDRTILIFESYKLEVDNYYFAQVIKKLFEREKEKAWGATISTITKEALSDFIIGLPSIDEQKRIGEFLKKMDDLILLQEKKLGLLKQQKQGFMQQMFI